MATAGGGRRGASCKEKQINTPTSCQRFSRSLPYGLPVASSDFIIHLRGRSQSRTFCAGTRRLALFFPSPPGAFPIGSFRPEEREKRGSFLPVRACKVDPGTDLGSRVPIAKRRKSPVAASRRRSAKEFLPDSPGGTSPTDVK